MKSVSIVRVVCVAGALFGSAPAARGAASRATSSGSCYGEDNLTVSFGTSLFPGVGGFVAVDYGFHDAISGGGSMAFMLLGADDFRVPLMARAAFHPFNLSVLAEHIPVREFIDVYAGLAAGYGFGAPPPLPVREYIGARFFWTDSFFGVIEEAGGLGYFNAGVGFSF